MAELTCPECGSTEPADARFCGGCGHSLLPSVAPSRPAASAPSPAADDGGGKGGASVLPWLLGGLFIGVGLAVLAGVVLLFSLVSRSNSSEDTYVSGPVAHTGAGTPTQGPIGVPPTGSQPTASELEAPGQYPYAATRSDCTQHARLSDVVKEVGIGVDQQMRTVETVSTEEEQQLGADYVDELPAALGGRLVKSGPLPTYLAGVARPLLEHVSRKDVEYHFYMLEDTAMENALALPGGYIVVTRPLFDRWATNEAQLATVIAHEIAHVDNRHPIAVVQYARALGIPDDDEVSQGLIFMAQMPYSSALEEESDREGARYLHQAGYSVFQAVSMWRARAAEAPADSSGGGAAPDLSDLGLGDLGLGDIDLGDLGGGGEGSEDPLAELLEVALGELEHLMSTHPDAGRRACLLEQQAFDLFAEQPRESVYIGQRNLAQRTPMADRRF
jgi:Zn-dependent protease with chaperone function